MKPLIVKNVNLIRCAYNSIVIGVNKSQYGNEAIQSTKICNAFSLSSRFSRNLSKYTKLWAN